MTFSIGTPYTKGAGYFVNDKALRSRQEADVQTCSHCQAVLKMQEWKNNGAWCGKCMKPICDTCGKRAEIFGCEPFMKKIEQYAEAQMRFEKFYKDAGLDKPTTPHAILVGSKE
jgi:hypothetical protein